MIRTYSTIFFAIVSMASMGQELTLKGVAVSQLTSQYVEVYVFESSMKLRTFDIVIDAGQIEEFADVFAKKNSPTGHNAQLLNADGSRALEDNPIAVLNYLDTVGGYEVLNMSMSIGQQGRYKHYFLAKRG